MLIVVKDACLLIDLVEIGLHETWCQLGVPAHTTDLVLAEVRHARQQEHTDTLVKIRALQIHPLKDTLLLEAAKIAHENGISLPDASAMMLAKQLAALLLTGDRKLRHTAKQYHIETHGMLWVLDFMVERKVLTAECATKHLESLLKRGSRYPKYECEARIKKWQTTKS